MIKSRFFILSLLSCFILLLPILLSLTKKSTGIKSSNSSVSKDEWVNNQLKSMSLREKIGQFFMVSAHPNKGQKNENDVQELIQDFHVGGIIFFQSDKKTLKKEISVYQSKAKVPLFIGLDAEWGSTMRLFDGDRFPYAYTLGAADDAVLSQKIASMMAQECREMGIHMNFSPVADVNSNPSNPVIGFRSFGENPKKVSVQVRSFVKGLQENGVMACIKHFPGHGNTSVDSHLDLPVLNQPIKELKDIDLIPFIEGIGSGAASVMLGHMSIPSIDPSKLPTSLSEKVIHDLLQKELSFKGLVISDALNMKAVADRYGKSEVAWLAFRAGCDILLCPEDVKASVNIIERKIAAGEYPVNELNARCRKILEAKYDYVISPNKSKIYSKEEIEFANYEAYEKAITVLKNENHTLPIGKLDKKIARISIGLHTAHFRDALGLFTDMAHFHFFTIEEALSRWPTEIEKYDQLILSFHSSTVRTRNNFGFGNDWTEVVKRIPKSTSTTLVIFGNPLVLQKNDSSLDHVDAVISAYENNGMVQDRVAQLIFGSIPAIGKLPFEIPGTYPIGTGLTMKTNGRLKFTLPEEVGISSQSLEKIDAIAKNGIEKGAYPGCQVVVALEGKVIYRKSFGKHTYEGNDSVSNSDVYDIASISKIAGSTIGLMRLQSLGKFSLDKTLGAYLPNLVTSYPHENFTLREMMAHQAGLPAWIPFYKRTLKNNQLNFSIYSNEKKGGFDTQVADNIWMKSSYIDSIYKQILTSSVGTKKYEYSDLGYYFVKLIIEKLASSAFEQFLTNEIYKPLGLNSMRYQPLKHFPIQRIIPTENDQVFRKQLVHGHVHDPGAAMLGGIGGHAGLFSNATDLAALMQMLLNKGMYAGERIIDPSIVEEYTKAQFIGNRRGAGFDRPNPSGGGTCHALASQQSFGHSGFTGTLAWADPTTGINYVFLSNRVCPSQDNWKLRDMNIRTEIQRVIYEAVKSRKQ